MQAVFNGLAKERLGITGRLELVKLDLGCSATSPVASVSSPVRADLDVADVKALLLGYQAMLRYRADPAATSRLTVMIHAGLQPPAS